MGQKIFLTPESFFSAIFTPRNDVFRKNFFSKKWPSKISKLRFFFAPPCKVYFKIQLNLDLVPSIGIDPRGTKSRFSRVSEPVGGTRDFYSLQSKFVITIVG